MKILREEKNVLSDRGVELHSGLMAGEMTLKMEQSKPWKVDECKQHEKLGRNF